MLQTRASSKITILKRWLDLKFKTKVLNLTDFVPRGEIGGEKENFSHFGGDLIEKEAAAEAGAVIEGGDGVEEGVDTPSRKKKEKEMKKSKILRIFAILVLLGGLLFTEKTQSLCMYSGDQTPTPGWDQNQ